MKVPNAIPPRNNIHRISAWIVAGFLFGVFVGWRCFKTDSPAQTSIVPDPEIRKEERPLDLRRAMYRVVLDSELRPKEIRINIPDFDGRPTWDYHLMFSWILDANDVTVGLSSRVVMPGTFQVDCGFTGDYASGPTLMAPLFIRADRSIEFGDWELTLDKSGNLVRRDDN